MQKARGKKVREKEQALSLKRLSELDRNQAALWRRVDDLIAVKAIKAYDEAVGILKDLRDLAVHKKRHEEFAERIRTIRERYPKLVGLRWRIDEAKLI